MGTGFEVKSKIKRVSLTLKVLWTPFDFKAYNIITLDLFKKLGLASYVFGQNIVINIKSHLGVFYHIKSLWYVYSRTQIKEPSI